MSLDVFVENLTSSVADFIIDHPLQFTLNCLVVVCLVLYLW
jgi:hypothetical protein